MLLTRVAYHLKISRLTRDLTRSNTELSQSQEALRKSLAEREQSLGQLAKLSAMGSTVSGLCHEIAQPLNIIKLIAQSLLRDARRDRLTKEDCEKDFPQLIGQVDRLAELTEHIRAYSRPVTGKPVEPFTLSQVVEDALKLLGQQLKDHNVDIVLELDAQLPAVSGHPTQIEQVVINLMNNARQAMEAAGTPGRPSALGFPSPARSSLSTGARSTSSP